jgi:hypothetical protein
MTLTTLLALTLSVAPLALVGAYGLSSQSLFHSLLALALAVVLIAVLLAVLLTRDTWSAPFDNLIGGMVGVLSGSGADPLAGAGSVHLSVGQARCRRSAMERWRFSSSGPSPPSRDSVSVWAGDRHASVRCGGPRRGCMYRWRVC